MLNYEQIMALPLRTCRECSKLVDGECAVYHRNLPYTDKPCRCVHFEENRRNACT